MEIVNGGFLLTDEAYDLGKELLGVSWKEIKIGDMEEYRKESLARYKEVAERHGAPLSYY